MRKELKVREEANITIGFWEDKMETRSFILKLAALRSVLAV
jgi:hypothetical protein